MEKLDYKSTLSLPIPSNFSIGEFFYSKTAEVENIRNTTSNVSIIYRITLLAGFMQYLRNTVNVPIYINSAYRCYDLNKAVKGVPNSHHLDGTACDFPYPDCSKVSAFKNLLKTLKTYGYLVEYVDHKIWAHIAINPKRMSYAQGLL